MHSQIVLPYLGYKSDYIIGLMILDLSWDRTEDNKYNGALAILQR